MTEETDSIEDGAYLTWRSVIHRRPGTPIVWAAAEGIHGDQAAAVLLAGSMIGMTPYQAIMVLAWDPDLRKIVIPEEAIFREPDGSWSISEEIQPGAGIHVLEAPRVQAGGIGRAPVPEHDPWTPGPGGGGPVELLAHGAALQGCGGPTGDQTGRAPSRVDAGAGP